MASRSFQSSVFSPQASVLSPASVLSYFIIHHSAFLGARSPRAEESDQVGHADLAVAIEVGGVAGVRAPGAEQNDQVRHAHHAVRYPLRDNRVYHVEEITRLGGLYKPLATGS